MKKTILLIGLIFLLVGCEKTLDDPNEDLLPPDDGDVEEYVNYDGYVSTLEINKSVLSTSIQYPGLSFATDYTNIMYSAVSQSLCVTVTINDPNYLRASYYLVGRYVGSTLEESRYLFNPTSSYTKFEACFGGVSLDRSYEVLVAKDDLDAPESHSTLISMNTITFYDPESYKRSVVYFVEDDDYTKEFLLSDEIPNIEISPRLKDEGRTIDSMEFVLRTREDRYEVDRVTIEIDESMYEGDILQIPLIIFSNLAPGLEYEIKGLMSGNDGIDDFEDVSAILLRRTTPVFENIEVNDVFYNMYAIITGLEVVDDNVVFSYIYRNETGTVLDFLVLVDYYDEDRNRIQELYSLDLNKNTFSVPLDSLKSGGVVDIKNADNNISFSSIIINPNKNRYNIYYPANETAVIELSISTDYYTAPISCFLNLYDENDVLLETIDLTSYDAGHYTFSVLTDYTEHDEVWSVITYEVDTLIGVMTHEYRVRLYPYG